MNRAQFLARAAALGILAAAGTGTEAMAGGRRLTFKGVAYDVGTGFLGDDSRAFWSRQLMRGEIRAISERLHANWVSVYGSDVGRLTETAEEVLRQGMKVSVQPRAFDQPQADALEQLRETAREAERLRTKYRPEVTLVIGCEFMLFTPGIVPGANFFERVEYLTKGEFDLAELQRKLRV